MKIRRFNDAGLAQFSLVIADRRQSAMAKRKFDMLVHSLRAGAHGIFKPLRESSRVTGLLAIAK